jgi:hypothetical protein
MRIFNLDEKYSVVCQSESTRSGFRHLATLTRGGYEIAKAKVLYYNRTWESYEFETVLLKIIDANFEGQEKETFRKAVKWENIR